MDPIDPIVTLGVIGAGGLALTLLYRRWVKKLDADTEASRRSRPPESKSVSNCDEFGEGEFLASLEAATRVSEDEAPPSQEPPRDPPSRDVLLVAQRIAEALQDTPWHSAYPEAALVLIRNGINVPGIEPALKSLILASEEDDEDAFVEAAEKMPRDEWYTVEAFGALRWPEALGRLGMARKLAPMDVLVDSLAKTDEAACLALLSALDASDLDAPVIGAALSSDAPSITALFEALGARLTGGDKEFWDECALRRLARTDLDAALAGLRSMRDERGLPWRATATILEPVTRRDVVEGAVWLGGLDGDAWDRLPVLLGCARGGIDIRGEMDAIVADLGDGTYRLPTVFGALIEYALAEEDAEFLSDVLRASGAYPWQITSCARDAFRALVEKDSASVEACLDALVEIRPLGPVARRSGMTPGHIMIRPDWLSHEDVDPLEFLVLQLAFEGATPRWSAQREG